MDIETFRWFMSTVAQTLGALTAIVVAVYVMWIERIRFRKEKISKDAKKFYCQNRSICDDILSNHGCEDYITFFNKDKISDNAIDNNNQCEKILLDWRAGFQRCLYDTKKAQQLWRPIFISLLSVFASLILLGFDRMIIPSAVNSTWGWACFFIISAMVLVSLFLYFVFLFDVVAPYYVKHSRWKRFWRGLFDKDYPYNQKKN